MTDQEAKAIFEYGVTIKEELPNVAPAYEVAIKALKAQVKLKECIANLDNPEFQHLSWSHEELLKLLKEHVV